MSWFALRTAAVFDGALAELRCVASTSPCSSLAGNSVHSSYSAFRDFEKFWGLRGYAASLVSGTSQLDNMSSFLPLRCFWDPGKIHMYEGRRERLSGLS